MRRVALVLLMGLPGSGKTTLCHKLLGMRTEGVQFRHICYDELLEVNDAEKWRDARDDLIRQVEHIIVNFGEASETLIILIDDNFYYQSMRRMYFKMAKKHLVPTCILYLQCPTELAVSRVQERSAQGGLNVDSETIRLMAEKLEPPVEHNWEKYSIEINSDQTYDVSFVWKSLFDLIKNASENQLRLDEPVVETCVSDEKSALQDADLALRKFISSEMQNYQSKGVVKLELAQLAQKLNSGRKQFLKQLSDNVDVTDVVYQFKRFMDG